MKHLFSNFPAFVSIAACIYTAVIATGMVERAAFIALGCVVFADMDARRRDKNLQERMDRMQDEINALYREVRG